MTYFPTSPFPRRLCWTKSTGAAAVAGAAEAEKPLCPFFFLLLLLLIIVLLSVWLPSEVGGGFLGVWTAAGVSFRGPGPVRR